MNFLKIANKTKVSPELLGEVMEMHANLPEEDRRDHTVRMIRLFQFLDAKGLQDQRADLSLAIDFRITALAHLLAAEGALGWTVPGVEPGMEMLHPRLVRSAAIEPLIEDASKQLAFDPESLRRRVFAKDDQGASA